MPRVEVFVSFGDTHLCISLNMHMCMLRHDWLTIHFFLTVIIWLRATHWNSEASNTGSILTKTGNAIECDRRENTSCSGSPNIQRWRQRKHHHCLACSTRAEALHSKLALPQSINKARYSEDSTRRLSLVWHADSIHRISKFWLVLP